MASAEMALRWNQIWSVMEAWNRQSDSSAMRERLLATAPPPKRARLAANAVATSTTATPDTAPSETASPLSVPHTHSFERPVTSSTAARSPRIFSFSKPRARADGATESPGETASPQPVVPRAAPSPRIFSFSKLRAHAGPAFANGDVTCVHGLNGRPDLNGQHCVLTAFHDDASRWAVRFMRGEEVRVGHRASSASASHEPVPTELPSRLVMWVC